MIKIRYILYLYILNYYKNMINNQNYYNKYNNNINLYIIQNL